MYKYNTCMVLASNSQQTLYIIYNPVRNRLLRLDSHCMHESIFQQTRGSWKTYGRSFKLIIKNVEKQIAFKLKVFQGLSLCFTYWHMMEMLQPQVFFPNHDEVVMYKWPVSRYFIT